jgi:RNA polymerase sigma-70 factor (ECF subfamily)
LEDRELVQKLLAKDEQAYRYFYDHYRDRIYKSCVYLLGYQDPDAEDVSQEVFLAALKQLPQFEFRSGLYHWLYRIAMYLCYERIRKRRRLIASLDEDLEKAADLRAGSPPDAAGEELDRKRALEVVEAQREKMGDPCKSLLGLREKQQKSYAQIADALKVPIGTVMSRLARCKEAWKALVLRALKEPSHGG